MVKLETTGTKSTDLREYAICWVSFFDNEMKMSKVSATDDRDALAQALNMLTGIEDTEHDSEWLHHRAFDCDGLIGAILI